MKKINLPTVLAYQKSLYTTLSKFFAYSSENEKFYSSDFKKFSENLKEVSSTIECTRTVRGDSRALKENEKNVGASNIQTKEKAILPQGTDSLFLSFSIIVNNDFMSPHATNGHEFKCLYDEFMKNLVENKDIVKKISSLYVEQIYNAEWTFRNLKVCKSFEVFVYNDRDKKLLNREEVESVFFNALTTNTSEHLKIHCLMKMTENAQVFPSQVFPTDDNKSTASGQLYKVNNQVAFSDVKINAGLRKFDVWYEENTKYKLVVNPLRVDQSAAFAYGKENNNHLYKYLTNLSEFNEELKTRNFNKFNENDYIFVLACMILGGLYNDTKKEV